MKAGLMLRLAKLELRHKEEDQVVHHRVIRLPWDEMGVPPPDLPSDGIVQVVYLPTKAPSAEAWAEKVRQHWLPEETSCRD